MLTIARRASQLEPDQYISGRDAYVAGFWDVGGVASATLAGFPRQGALVLLAIIALP
jgi:hypothetical protein